MDFLLLLAIGLLIALAKMVDVTIGTLRVISVIDGRLKTSFLLGFVEVIIWLAVISITLERVQENPLFGIFFALGFSLGNVAGILLERRIPLGNLTLRVVGGLEVREVAARIRELGLGATVLPGEGRDGERLMLFTFLPKSFLRRVQAILQPRREHLFYTIDYGGVSNKVLLPAHAQPAGTRRFFRRK